MRTCSTKRYISTEIPSVDFKGVPCRDCSSAETNLQCPKLCASFLSLWLSVPLQSHTHSTLQSESFNNFLYRIQKHISKAGHKLPWWLSGKGSACQCRRSRFDPWMGKIPWRRKRESQVLLPGKSHGERSLVGYSPWSCQELDRISPLNNNKAGLRTVTGNR